MAISRRALWGWLGTLVPSASAVAALGLWPLWHTQAPTALAVSSLFAALFAVGVVLMAEPGQAPAGMAMIVSAVLLIVSWANEWAVGPLPLASAVVGGLWPLGMAWALYRYPGRRLDDGDRWMFRALLAWFAATSWLLVFLSRPQWHQFPPHWWPALFPDLAAYRIATRVVNAATVGVALLYVSRWAVRLHRSKGVQRHVMLPTAVAAGGAITIGSTLYIGHALDLPDSVDNVLLTVTIGGMFAIPVAFLVAVIRRYLSRTALTEMLIRLGGSPTTEQISATLRDGLRDPGLRILYWWPAKDCYADDAGLVTADAVKRSGRLAREIPSSHDEPMACLMGTAAPEYYDLGLIDAAVVAVRISMENALLLETVEAQLAELQAASARVMEAGARERHRIQRDLHDGIQGKLAGVGLRLGALKATTTDRAATARIAGIQDNLAQILADFGPLVADIRPVVLGQGLRAAVIDLCGHYDPGLAVTVDLPDGRLPEAVEDAAFLAISEALTNVVKHAQTGRARVSGQVENGELTISVTDHGVGGARLSHGTDGHGTGLMSITDRVTTLKGRVRITVPPGGGTEVTMRIPCA